MLYRLHTRLEQKVLLLGIGILITVSIGGFVEITPLYTIKTTIERVQGGRQMETPMLKRLMVLASVLALLVILAPCDAIAQSGAAGAFSVRMRPVEPSRSRKTTPRADCSRPGLSKYQISRARAGSGVSESASQTGPSE